MINKEIRLLQENYVIGLTATPPEHNLANSREFAVFFEWAFVVPSLPLYTNSWY